MQQMKVTYIHNNKQEKGKMRPEMVVSSMPALTFKSVNAILELKSKYFLLA